LSFLKCFSHSRLITLLFSFDAFHPKRSIQDIADELRPILRSRITDLAETFLGPPNRRLSNRAELRWGNRGSFRVTIAGAKQGACADFETNWTGDPFDLIERERDCSFTDAVLWGANWAGVDTEGRQAAPEDPVAKQARQAEQDHKRAEAEAQQAQSDAARVAQAQTLWAESMPIEGSPAEAYLTQRRSIPAPATGWPDQIRFHSGSCALIVAGTLVSGDVRYVQRVFLTPDGKKISQEELERRSLSAAKLTRGVMGDAYVRLPGASDGPLLLAEGSETGLSLWAATGHETWLATGNNTRHQPPTGRTVILCRDDDASDEPLARKLPEWSATGANILIATPWPDRRRDKSDFNDTIKAGGVAAIRERIQAALTSSWKPPHRYDLDEARHALRQEMAASMETFSAWGERHKAAFVAAYAKLSAAEHWPIEYGVAQRAAASCKAANAEVARLRKERPADHAALAAARKRRDADRDALRAAKKCVREPEVAHDIARIKRRITKQAREHANATAGLPPVHAIRVDTGAGKTRTAEELVAELVASMRAAGDNRTVIFAVPTHKLGLEQVKAFNRLPAAKANGLKADMWVSRNGSDPQHADYLDPDVLDRNKVKMCLDLDAVSDAQEAKVPVRDSVCRRKLKNGTVVQCQFFEVCGYERQRAAKADVWFIAHQKLFRKLPAELGEPAIIIIDEGFHNAGLKPSSFVTLDELLRIDAVPGLCGETQQLSMYRERLRQALEPLHDPTSDDDTPIPRDALTKAGIGPDEAAEVRRLEYMRKLDADIVPNMPPMRRQQQVAAVAINKSVMRQVRLWTEIGNLSGTDGPKLSGWLSLGFKETKNGHVRCIKIEGRESIHLDWIAPTLILNATLDMTLVKPYYPNAVLRADIGIQTPHMRVRQVVDRSYSKDHLIRGDNLVKVRATLLREAYSTSGRILVVIQKEFEEQLRKTWLPPNVELAHHNGVAGRDEWGPQEDCPGVAKLIVVGRTFASEAAVEADAMRLTGVYVPRARYAKSAAIREMANGKGIATLSEQHPDAMCEALRSQITEGELIQDIGRGRGVTRTAENPLEVLIMTNVVLPIPLAQALSHKDLDPTPWDLMLADGGVALESPTDAASAYPHLWSTPDAAKQAFNEAKKAGRSWGQNQPLGIKSLLDISYRVLTPKRPKCPQPLLRLQYRVAGKKRQAAIAVFDPDRVSDIQAWLEELVQNIDWVFEPPVAPPKQNIVEQMAAEGIVFNNARHAAAFYPSLGTFDATKKALGRVLSGQDVLSLEYLRPLSFKMTYQLAGPGQAPAIAFASSFGLMRMRLRLEGTLGKTTRFDYEIWDEELKVSIAWVQDLFESYTPPPMPAADWHGWTTYAEDIFPDDGRDAVAPEALAEAEKQPWFRSLTAEGLRRYWADAV
jgi:hypothetical protein